jgi:hypothetical protein
MAGLSFFLLNTRKSAVDYPCQVRTRERKERCDNNALDAEPPIASFLESTLIGGGPVNAGVRQSMKQRFNPDRQGAAHVLERSDIAIVRGTPVYTADGSLHDNRIRISVNGFAECALWIDYSMDNPTGLRSEFHRWASQLTPPDLQKIILALEILTRTAALDVTQFSNDSIVCIRHWDKENERTSFVLNGSDQYPQRIIPLDDERSFCKAWNLIQDSIPGRVSCRIDELGHAAEWR